MRMTWLIFALMTVVSWGLYGVLLHTGQVSMSDPVHGRYKAFLFVGDCLSVDGGHRLGDYVGGQRCPVEFSGEGYSLVNAGGAGGSVGAFGVLLAFGAKGTPPVVMSIVFAGRTDRQRGGCDGVTSALREAGGLYVGSLLSGSR